MPALSYLINRFVTNDLGLNTDQETIRRVKMINIGGAALITAGIFWVVIDALFWGRLTSAMIEGLALLIGAVLLCWQRKVTNISLVTNIAVAVIVVTLLSFQILYGIEGSSTFWLYLIPPFAYFLAGEKLGTFWSLTPLLAVLVFTTFRLFISVEPSSMSEEYLLDFVSSYLILMFISYSSERARAEATKSLTVRNEEMRRFLRTVSHDLGTPLTSLQGFLTFIKEDWQSGDRKKVDEDIAKTQKIASTMTSMVYDIVALSRIGRGEEERVPVKIDEVIKNLLVEEEPQIQIKRIKIETQPDFPTVTVNRRKIEEIYRNLVSNAIKYMGDQPQPQIKLGWKESAHNYQFFVQDNGIGIDEVDREKIFNSFYRKSRDNKGMGVGLSIVKGFVEDAGGRVWVDSKLGEGSTFWFRLPKKPQAVVGSEVG